ncbi:2-C-methyl-D-erythritol 2,4-cyclodiphosphate synthase [Kribbella antibiotica]|uniref:2-C-methyl-D-erythritol 2,4-cyclodiphosphate synthase n=1 Tax=Kribbella antibiotica TaxID=190195 RepID=A0A4R4ZTQ0_9ACTN|nr:2-C-methyl-D-erythritol 2,4-cyclodiphosphate synthase [Kribbella antibiotica]TDD61514.1 2-C-methyl-D-erythritol 2,4-cyclodiphosphate synthase [Kribbella antibiotica]
MDIRTGLGFDVHPFSSAGASRPLILGGVEFPGECGLVGLSDADVIAHAIGDSLLGPAGLGDMGEVFPESDERCVGADSIELLREIVALVANSGWRPLNVDCVTICERPILSHRRVEMSARLTGVVGAPVTVKGKRAEGLGALGRAEGIACWASTLLAKD